MTQTIMQDLLEATVPHQLHDSLLGGWQFFRSILKQTAARAEEGGSFRWQNGGGLSQAFNAMLDKVTDADSQTPLPTLLENLSVNLECLATAMQLDIPKSRFATKIKDWKAGGTRYANGGNKQNGSRAERNAAMLHFLRQLGSDDTTSPTFRQTAAMPQPIGSPLIASFRTSHQSPTKPDDKPQPTSITLASPKSGNPDLIDDRPYPTPSDKAWIQSLLPASRLKFDLPPANDGAQWKILSLRLQQSCQGLGKDPQGARGIDKLHLALTNELSSLGLASPPQQPHNKGPRKSFQHQRQTISTANKMARSKAEKGTAKHREAWANTKIKIVIDQTASDIEEARLTRRHHKLAATNPKKLADAIWGRAMGSDPPECTKEDCASFFTDIFRALDPPDASPSWLPQQCPALPLHPLNITPSMVYNALKKKGSKQSAPGLDGITYNLLLRLPWMPSVLAPLFNKVVAQRTCPEFWRYGITTLLHKGGARDLSNYRPITLTATISKLFHSIVAAWLEKALTTNNIIQTSVQKGFLLGISGAIEHDLVLDATLAEARKHNKNLFMVLVDLKNAFGSVPHSRIKWALQRYGIPDWVNDYVDNFYSGVHTKLFCKDWETAYIQVNRGVLQGDTLSPLLFLLVMQVGLQALAISCHDYGYKTSDGREHFLKCFADDLTIVTRSPKRLQLAVNKLQEITSWLGMEIKPSKCRTFGTGKGGYRKINIDIAGQTILNIEDATSKFLGMELSLSQSPKEKAQIASKSLLQIIRPLHEFPLPNRDKVQLYRNFALPKMRWVLLVQDVLPTALRSITSEIEQYLKKWWHLPRSTSRDALRLVTGIPSISDIATQSQCTKYSVANASTDPNVTAVLSQRRASKHKPVRHLLKALGGSIPTTKKQAMNQIKEGQLSQLRETVGKLLIQGAWQQLGQDLAADRQWRSIMWSLPPTVQQFATKAVIDVLPTRANLLRWKVSCNSACPNCGVKETLQHVLNSCQRLLNNGAYKWRHDSILQQLAHSLQTLHPSSNIMADLPGRTYRLPFQSDTDFRPDIVVSHRDSTVEFIELTVPFESNWKAAHDRKTNKYAALLDQAKAEGLLPTLSCIEMGSRGLPSHDWDAWISKKRLPKSLTKTCSSIAMSASQIVWLHKATVWPNPPPMRDLRTKPDRPATWHPGKPQPMLAQTTCADFTAL